MLNKGAHDLDYKLKHCWQEVSVKETTYSLPYNGIG